MTRRKDRKPGAGPGNNVPDKAPPASSTLKPSEDNPERSTLPTTMEPVYTWEENRRPAKRQKTKNTEDAHHQASTALKSGPQEDIPDIANSGVTTAKLSTERLPSELRHIQDRFEFTTMSIVSSSKMEQRVRNLLLRTKRLPEGTKPGVVILTAKADVASKMVGIVEIAKRTIRQEGGKWWQYSKLHSQVIELKKKKTRPKRAEGGRTLREWADEQEEKGEPVSGGMKENHNGDHDMPDDKGARLDDQEKDEDEDEGAFQTMGRQQVMAYDENRSKMRAIPIMTIYLSQVPVPALRSICR